MFHAFSDSQFKKFIVAKRDKYRCRIRAFFHTEVGVGHVENKEQGRAAFSKMQRLSLISLKGESLDITENEQSISSLEV